jgi:RND family efflux transporter MFP subunit
LNKKVVISVISLLVISAPVTYFTVFKKDAKVEIETVKVEKGNIVSSITANGRVVPNLEVEIKCKASGEIVSLPFDISNKVLKGNLLLKLNPVDENRNYNQAEINVLQSKIALSKAESDFLLSKNRYVNSKNQSLISLESSKTKTDELKNKAERSRKLYLLSPQRKILESQIESAKTKYIEMKSRASNAQEMYKKNQLISKSDYDSAMTQLKQSETDLRNAEMKLKEQDTINFNDYESAIGQAKQAQYDYKMAKLKQQQQGNDAIEIDIKQKDIESARARLKADQISLLNAKQRLDDTQVYSPIDGVITERNVQVGQIISSGISSTNGGTTVLKISDLSKLFVMVNVDESDIGKIVENQKATITVDAYRNKKFDGKVVQIYTKGANNSNVITFQVKVEVTGKNKNLLKPEMNASVEIVSEEKNNVLLVDSSAVKKRKNKFFVVEKTEKYKAPKDRKDKIEGEKEIKAGLFDGEKYEIISGVTENQELVVYSDFKKNSNDGPPMGF